MKSEKKQANFCIMIFISEEARWRICSYKKSDIKKLHLKIVYSVIKSKAGKNQNVLERLIQNPKGLLPPTISDWDWHHQDKWNGACKSGVMQSPINISTNYAKKAYTNFQMDMKLAPTHALIKRNFGELIIVFLNFAGVLKLEVHDKYISYTPQYISFRFPGETIIDGARSLGDMQIHFAELAKNRVIFISIFNYNILFPYFFYDFISLFY
jgi:hypothetical protein